MAATKRDLTDPERKFIIETLSSVRLSGDRDALKLALDTIDSIIEKLSPSDIPPNPPDNA